MDNTLLAPPSLTLWAARLRQCLTATFLLLLVAIIAERAGYSGAYRGAASAASMTREAALALPSLLYVAGLWQLRQAVAVVGSTPFAEAAVLGVSRLGWCLVAGSTLSLVAMPLLHRLSAASYPRLLDLDVSTLVIGAVGAGLVLLARLLAHAASLQSELDAYF